MEYLYFLLVITLFFFWFSSFVNCIFTISQNYFIFMSLKHLIEIGNSFEK
jgi:hypothetical protein